MLFGAKRLALSIKTKLLLGVSDRSTRQVHIPSSLVFLYKMAGFGRPSYIIAERLISTGTGHIQESQLISNI